MNKYIGTKLIEAEFEDSTNGYKVRYADGYESWSSKDVFEKAYLKVDDNKDLPSGVSIGQKMVDDFIKSYEVVTMGDRTTVVRATLINDFQIVEASSCVDAKNYSEALGTEICLGRIKNKVWELLGFLLQSAYKGFK